MHVDIVAFLLRVVVKAMSLLFSAFYRCCNIPRLPCILNVMPLFPVWSSNTLLFCISIATIGPFAQCFSEDFSKEMFWYCKYLYESCNGFSSV